MVRRGSEQKKRKERKTVWRPGVSDPKTSRKGEATRGPDMAGYFINSLKHGGWYMLQEEKMKRQEEAEHWFNAVT